MALDLGTLVGYMELDDSEFRGPLDRLPGEVRSAGGKAEGEGQGIGAKMGRAVGNGLKGAATGTVTVLATGLGVALTKGFQRLEGIDNARKKLTGLGHDAGSVDNIMNNALASVKGTAYGIGDAATVAASAVAAGIQPGADLERTLKLTADAATIAGTDMNSMGAIFNKVAASNKVQMDVINQLHDAGVPALSALADHMGVTAEEASKMASAGKIDFETFQAAMEASLGGAAQSSGDTFSGAMANVGAALGRVGAGLMGGIFPILAPLLQAIGNALGPVEEKAAALGEAIGARLVPWIERLIGWLEKGPGELGEMNAAIGPLVGAFIALGASGLAPLLKMVPGLGGLSKALGFLGGPIGLLIGAFVGLLAVSPELRAALGQIAGVLGGVLSETFSALVPAIMPIVELLGGVLVDVLAQLAPILVQIAEFIGGLLVTAVEAIAPLFPILAEVLQSVLTAALPLIDVVMTLIEAFAPLLPVLGDLIGALLPPLAELLIALLTPILELVAPLLDLLVPALQFLADVISVVVGAVTWLIEALVGLVTGNEETYAALSEVWEAIKQFFIGIGEWWSSLWASVTSFAKDAWNGLISWFRGIPGWIQGIFSSAGQWLLNAGTNIVTGLRSGVTNMWNSFISWVRGFPQQIIGFFAGAGQWLWDAGKNVVQGLMDGVSSLAGSIGQFFLDLLPGWIVGPFKAALGINSPSRVFREYGRNIVQGIPLGLDDEQGNLDARMRDLVETPAAPSVGAAVNNLTAASGQDANREAERWAELMDQFEDLAEAIKDARPIEVHSNDPEEVATVVGEHLR